MAASDPTTDVATPTGTLQGVATFAWDGAAWQPSAQASPSVATPTGVLRGLAPFAWDGATWQPAGRAQPGVATPSGVLDGAAIYTWSGSAWTPPGGQPSPATPSGSLRGVAAFNWDGATWQPAGQAGPSVATPYGVLAGVALFNWTGGAWAATAQGPSMLDISFMTPGFLEPRITFLRASVGTYIDANGALQIAAADVPRWDYDPVSHLLNGVLIEETRTNLLLNSAALSTQSVTTTAVATTLSFYGTGTVTKSGTATGALVGTGAAQRVSQTFTPTAGSLTLTVTGSVTNAQLEAGTFATSYIPTAGASAQRIADACYMPIGSWFNTAASSLVGEFMVGQSPNPGAPVRDVCAFTDQSPANRLILRGLMANVATAQFATSIASSHTTSPSAGSVAASAVTKLGAAWNGTTGTGCLNGAATVSYSVGVPSSLSRLTFGNDNPTIGAYLNGWVRRVRYWPRALSGAELQAATT